MFPEYFVLFSFGFGFLALCVFLYLLLGFLYASAELMSGRSFIDALDTYRRNMDPEAFNE